MERENQNDRDEFDPSESEEFFKNLEKAFEPETETDGQITIEEPQGAWIEIGEEQAKPVLCPEQDAGGQAEREQETASGQAADMDAEEIPAAEDLFPIEDEFRVDLSGIDEFNKEEFEKQLSSGKFPDGAGTDELPDDKEEKIFQEITESLAETAGTQDKPEEEKKPSGKKKLPKFVLPVAAVAGSVLLICIFLFGTKPGRRLIINIAARYAESRMNYDDGSDHEVEDIEDDVDISDADLTQIPEITVIPEENIHLGAEEGEARQEDEIVNILLLGEEAIGSGSARGRTDLIMIATMDLREKSYKLTSLMRDLLVEIPGHADNKLNSAYQIGGIPLLYETIERNFDLKIDGYCMVGFDDFEEIVDLLDGIDITLTQTEANYLNRTNYISNPGNRTMRAGVNHMNGNQVVGYCRVRYVGTGTESNDFGRTQRHRTVLNTIFDKVKSLSYITMLRLVNDCLPFVTTDMKSGQITDYVEEALEIGLTRIENFRVPAEGTYEAGYVRKMAVLVPNLPENVKLLHEFIFGEEPEKQEGQEGQEGKN